MLTLIAFSALSILLTHVDSLDLRLPDRILVPGALLVISSDVLSHLYVSGTLRLEEFLDPAYAALIAGAVALLLHVSSPQGMGFGDVKLMPVVAWMISAHAGSVYLFHFTCVAAGMLFITGVWKKIRSGSGSVFAAGPVILISAWVVLASVQLTQQ